MWSNRTPPFKMTSSLLIEFAFDQDGYKCSPTQGDLPPRLYCPRCLQEVVLRRGGDIRVDHFAHRAGTSCAVEHKNDGEAIRQGGPGESEEHRRVKEILRAGFRAWVFQPICCNDGCSLATRVSRPSCLTDPHKFTHALTEQSILSLPHYKVDVGVFGRNGQMKVAIEVLHTHAIGKEKHEALSKLVEVYEVRTEEVFRAIAAGDLIVSYKTLNEQCQSCWEAETQLCLCCHKRSIHRPDALALCGLCGRSPCHVCAKPTRAEDIRMVVGSIRYCPDCCERCLGCTQWRSRPIKKHCSMCFYWIEQARACKSASAATIALEQFHELGLHLGSSPTIAFLKQQLEQFVQIGATGNKTS